MKYIYADRTIFYEDKKFLLDWCEEERPFIQDKETKEKTVEKLAEHLNF